jgi:uncharacterized phage protein (TIGR02220 family)
VEDLRVTAPSSGAVLRDRRGYFTCEDALFELGLSTGALAVYVFLARCANKAGTAFPSHATIAERTRSSPRSVKRALSELSRVGAIRRDSRKAEGRPNLYTLQPLTALVGGVDPPDLAAPAGSTQSARPMREGVGHTGPAEQGGVGHTGLPVGHTGLPGGPHWPTKDYPLKDDTLKDVLLLSGSPNPTAQIALAMDPGTPTEPAPVPAPPRESAKDTARALLAFLNEKTGHGYRPVETNLALIVARLNSGVSAQDIRSVIASKVRQWRVDPHMAPYLRPSTLFRASNFEQYFGQLYREPAYP